MATFMIKLRSLRGQMPSRTSIYCSTHIHQHNSCCFSPLPIIYETLTLPTIILLLQTRTLIVLSPPRLREGGHITQFGDIHLHTTRRALSLLFMPLEDQELPPCLPPGTGPGPMHLWHLAEFYGLLKATTFWQDQYVPCHFSAAIREELAFSLGSSPGLHAGIRAWLGLVLGAGTKINSINLKEHDRTSALLFLHPQGHHGLLIKSTKA